MNRELSLVRDYMLSANPPDRWETSLQIATALRGKYGLFCTRMDVIVWLRELSEDGTHSVQVRTREDSAVKEYRLSVNPIAPGGAKK
jgi:hypothetical protein